MTEIIIQLILLPIFLGLSVILFTIPGRGLLKYLKILPLDTIELYTISTILGFVVFTLIAYFLAFLHLRILIWLIPIMGLVLFFIDFKELKKISWILNKKLLWVFLITLVLGVVFQVVVNAPSGFPYMDGIYFYSSHGHDGIWHLSLMEQMHKDLFPFQNPVLAGNMLQNYHFFSDLLMSEVSRMFPFSNLDIYFRLFPVLFSILMGLGSFVLIKLWSKSEIAGIWAMFFTYFAGSFGYLLTIPRYHNLVGETIFWVSQTQSVLGNPPHATAFIILIGFMILLFRFFESNQIKLIIPLIILGGAVIEFKVYAGVLILTGLATVSFYSLSKKNFRAIGLFVGTLVFSLAIYLPNTNNSQEFLIWQPWFYIRTMVVAPDRLNWLDLERRRQTFLAQGNIKRVVSLEALAFLMFLLGNLGMRFLGFLSYFKKIRSLLNSEFELFFLTIITLAFFIPVFFIQKGVAWNTIQFNQYFLLLFGFLAAISISQLLEKTRFKMLLIILIILLAIPTQIGLLWQFYSNRPLSKVTYQELTALDFLKKNTPENAIILTAPFERYLSLRYQPPVPIYSWSETAYVSAFSNRTTLISDSEQVNIMGYDDKKLLDDRAAIFPNPAASLSNSKDPKLANDFFNKYGVDYVYLVYNQQFSAPIEKLDLKLIYQSSNVRIFKHI